MELLWRKSTFFLHRAQECPKVVWPGVSVFHLYILILCDTSDAKVASIPWGPKQAPCLLGKE